MELNIKHLIELAFAEDIGSGDITSDFAIEADAKGEGYIVAKQDLILAGACIAEQVFKTLDPCADITAFFKDGDTVKTGETVMEFKGLMRALLKGERTALNFLQRLSGIATNVRSYADEMAGSRARLVDTRKTIPGWRVLEKYAVRVGGAFNHRMSLSDGVLIKDNHIAACGGIKHAVDKIRHHVSHLVKIEVEVTTMDEIQQALDARADVIMLDNMDLDQVRDAVAFIAKRALVEVSGNVTKDRLKDLAATGVDIISSGALTHQARAVDLSMRIR
ncbi:MAG: carboxylating nicotinate-nucleotide diphosphorylase [Proteobacteria bacterium]|nr:carboxylating nicotinate-nucleotide diphosphorylase [Pseudomonadota bacterium]